MNLKSVWVICVLLWLLLFACPVAGSLSNVSGPQFSLSIGFML